MYNQHSFLVPSWHERGPERISVHTRRRGSGLFYRSINAAWYPDFGELSTHPSSFDLSLALLCQQRRFRTWPRCSLASTLALAPATRQEKRLTVWCYNPVVLSKNISPSNGAALYCPDLSTCHSPPPHPPNSSILYSPTYTWSRQLYSVHSFFFSNQYPADPDSGP